jgi:hypothetical protein
MCIIVYVEKLIYYRSMLEKYNSNSAPEHATKIIHKPVIIIMQEFHNITRIS